MIKRGDKKAWLRIVEAFIAIILVMTVLLVVISKKSANPDVFDEIIKIERHILDQIQEEPDIRTQILSGDLSSSNKIVENFLPYGFSYQLKNCSLKDICSMEKYVDEEVYTQEMIISANLTEYSPVVLKVFLWRGD